MGLRDAVVAGAVVGTIVTAVNAILIYDLYQLLKPVARVEQMQPQQFIPWD